MNARRLCAGIAIVLVLLVWAAASQAEPPVARPQISKAVGVRRGQPIRLSQDTEIELLVSRGGLAFAALVLVAAGGVGRGAGSNPRVRRARSVALALIAVASYASYYNFFRFGHLGGMKETDVFHYYMGSKYAADVGYFDLYDCTVAVLVADGTLSSFDLPPVRDQRTLAMQSTGQSLARSQQCRKGFVPERWQAFEADVRWFSKHFTPGRWPVVLRDHGYNPTPIWSAIGGFLTSRVSLGSSAFEVMLLADRVLLLLGIGSLAWAFGFEAGAIALIVWGTAHHWGYTWIGDSLLRNLWLSALLIGLALYRKAHYAAAGALLMLTSALRIFPAITLVAAAVQAMISYRASGALPMWGRRLLIAAGGTGLLLLAIGLMVSAGGTIAYFELAEKMSAFASHPGVNKVGLPPLVWNVVMMAHGTLATSEGKFLIMSPPTPTLRSLMQGLQLLVTIPSLYFFWRASKRAAVWQVPLLALALIPILSGPANYYYSFILGLLLLGTARRRVYLYVLACCVLWLANGVIYVGSALEYLGASMLAVLLCLAILIDFGLLDEDLEIESEVEVDSASPGPGQGAGAGGQE